MITKEAFAEARAAHPDFKLVRCAFNFGKGRGCAISLLYLHNIGATTIAHDTPQELADFFKMDVGDVWQFVHGWDDANHYQRLSDNPHYLLGYELAEQYMYS